MMVPSPWPPRVRGFRRRRCRRARWRVVRAGARRRPWGRRRRGAGIVAGVSRRAGQRAGVDAGPSTYSSGQPKETATTLDHSARVAAVTSSTVIPSPSWPTSRRRVLWPSRGPGGQPASRASRAQRWCRAGWSVSPAMRPGPDELGRAPGSRPRPRQPHLGAGWSGDAVVGKRRQVDDGAINGRVASELRAASSRVAGRELDVVES